MRRSWVLAAILLLIAISVAPASGAQSHPRPHDSTFAFAGGSVVVHVPREPLSVGVVVLHSLDNSAAEPVAQGWSAASDQFGFVAIYPDRGPSWNAGLCCGSASSTGRDDVSWLTRVIALVQTRYNLTSILLAGFSNGGMMVERLVTERPSITFGFAVWGSAPEMPEPGRWSGTGTMFDGSEDIIVPPAGGVVTFDGSPEVIRATDTTSAWILGAHLQTRVIAGLGHRPPRDWPEMAWAALTAN